MHALIVGCTGEEIADHWNHDTLDNRRNNLRKCTHSQNQWNQKRSKRNTSGFKGVTWEKRRGKWHAQIRVNGKQKYLGEFLSIEDAARAYDRAAEMYHGEFGVKNFAS
jgi:hypothetical protein